MFDLVRTKQHGEKDGFSLMKGYGSGNDGLEVGNPWSKFLDEFWRQTRTHHISSYGIWVSRYDLFGGISQNVILMV